MLLDLEFVQEHLATMTLTHVALRRDGTLPFQYCGSTPERALTAAMDCTGSTEDELIVYPLTERVTEMLRQVDVPERWVIDDQGRLDVVD